MREKDFQPRSPRDWQMLAALPDYRLLTTRQIEQLFFTPATSGRINTRCQHRLTVLSRHGLVARWEQPQPLSAGRKPFVYLLSKRGASLLASHLHQPVDWQPYDNQVSAAYVAHTLAVNDFRIAVTLAARQPGFTLETWLSERALKREPVYVAVKNEAGKEQKAAVIPDGYFHLVVEKDGEEWDYHHVVEVDRATVTGESSVWGRRDWSRKVRAYLAYYHSGLYEQKFGTRSLRVLTVTTGDKRLAHLKSVTERVGGKRLFWFTLASQVTPETVLTAPIWQMASADGLHALLR